MGWMYLQLSTSSVISSTTSWRSPMAPSMSEAAASRPVQTPASSSSSAYLSSSSTAFAMASTSTEMGFEPSQRR